MEALLDHFQLEESKGAEIHEREAGGCGQNFVSHIFEKIFACHIVESSMKMTPNPVATNTNIAEKTQESRRIHQNRKGHPERHTEAVKTYQIVMGRQVVPSWEKEPDPIPGWTLEEQRLLIAASKALQNDRILMIERGYSEEMAHWEYLRQIARRVPGKTAEECNGCLKHVERVRIAYFGTPSQKTNSACAVSRSSSPLRTLKPMARSPSSRRCVSDVSSNTART